MNSRERALAALNHQEPDKVPIDLGSTIVTSITRTAYDALRAYLKIRLSQMWSFRTGRWIRFTRKKTCCSAMGLTSARPT